VTTSLERVQGALAGRYQVLRELGQGGMATVYLAEDVKHRRKVAVKVLRPELAAALGPERFLREIEIAAQLQHPHILPLLDSGEAGPFLYYVMPYIEGESLRDRLVRQGELPVHEAVKLLCEIVDALAHAHTRNVVHRDIKPDNVMLSGRHALVMDFGVAKAVSEATGRQHLTTAGVALGTPAYMAPEQATADPHLDHRVDIYAVGAMGYELLAGRPPFTASTPQQVLAAQVTQTPDSVRMHRPSISPGLEQIIMRCLAKRPADRWQSAEELLVQLEPLVTPSGGVTPAETRPVTTVSAPRVSRRPILLAAAAVLVAGVAAAVLAHHRFSVLTVGRRVQVTLDPGLEVDPALSPDGKFVAYAAGPATAMKLYVRQLGGASGVVITPNQTGVRRPMWSPDGDRIAFSSATGMYVVGALGGIPRLLVEGLGTMAWSPDGRRIAYARGDTLYTRALDGGAPKLVATGFELYSPTWSRDGAWIAYASGNPLFLFGGLQMGNLAPSRIWVVPADGGRQVLVSDSTSLNIGPVWLPGARELLYVSNRDGGRDVYRVTLGRSGVPDAPPDRLTAGLNAHTISLSADGKLLAYATYTQTSNVWSLPILEHGIAATSQATSLTTGTQIVEAVALSHDGRWLAFDSDRSGNQDIYKVPIEGGEPQQLTTNSQDDFGPSWSPDGTEIAFHSFLNGNRDIYTVSANGGEIHPVVVGPAQDMGANWSPDGRQLCFRSDRTGRVLIYVVSRENGKWGRPRRLSQSAGDGPRWSPDGRLIGYSVGSGLQFVSPELGDAGPVRRLVFDSLLNVNGWAWSADDRGVFVKARHVQQGPGIWYLPLEGAPRQVVRVNDPAVDFGTGYFTAGRGRLYFTLAQRESDIWTAALVTR
jgi:Tol biopolymer transport system component/tRNA A-37 threonylcarbamoyl transferase component Bud32